MSRKMPSSRVGYGVTDEDYLEGVSTPFFDQYYSVLYDLDFEEEKYEAQAQRDVGD